MEEDTQPRINFIPCVKWVKRGVAKSDPEKVSLKSVPRAKITRYILLGAIDKGRARSNYK